MKRLVAAFSASLLVAIVLPAWVSAQGWQNVRLNDDTTLELQNEQQVVVNPVDPGNLVAVWRDFRLGYRQVGYGYTFDRGAAWTNPGLFVDVHYPRDSDPALTVNHEGDFFAIVLAYTGDTDDSNGMLMFRSTDGGQTWEDRGFAVNGVPGVFEDKEFIACDRTSMFFRGRLYLVWTRFWDTDILCVSSGDEGQTWTSEVQVSDASGNQFPTPAVGPDGTVYVAWTHFGTSSIKIDYSFGGLGFGVDQTVTAVSDPDPLLNGSIAAPAHPAMDIDITGGDHNGRIYIAYMSSEGSSDFDIFIRHSDDHGLHWSGSRRINDDAFGNGRDQFLPWLTVDNLGVVSVVWLDRRHDPANLSWHCYLSQSFDGGMTWSPNQQVSTEESNPADALVPPGGERLGKRAVPTCDEAGARAGLIGEYIGIACWDGFATPVWTDTRNGHQDTYGGTPSVTGVGDAEQPVAAVLRLTPNPASGPVRFSFVVPENGWVSLDVFDLAGRRVRTLVDRNVRGGTHEFLWGGTDQAGRTVATGTYLVHFRAPGLETTRTVTVFR